jgi:hypothetical protein
LLDLLTCLASNCKARFSSCRLDLLA